MKIKLKENKVVIEQTEKEIERLMLEGIIYEPSKDVFKFLDKSENIFVIKMENQNGRRKSILF
jgi:hypothetical protein